MIDLKKIPKDELELAEKFAMEYHYPDSVAKGIKDKSTGEYIEEVEITMRIFLEGLRGQHFQCWMCKKLTEK